MSVQSSVASDVVVMVCLCDVFGYLGVGMYRCPFMYAFVFVFVCVVA